MPPEIPVVFHVTFFPCTFNSDAGSNRWGSFHGLIGDGFQVCWLTTSEPSICCDQDITFGIRDAFCQGFHAESSINDTVRSPDLGTSQHGNNKLRDLGHVYSYNIPLLGPHGL